MVRNMVRNGLESLNNVVDGRNLNALLGVLPPGGWAERDERAGAPGGVFGGPDRMDGRGD